jgi:hypothetical protein
MLRTNLFFPNSILTSLSRLVLTRPTPPLLRITSASSVHSDSAHYSSGYLCPFRLCCLYSPLLLPPKPIPPLPKLWGARISNFNFWEGWKLIESILAYADTFLSTGSRCLVLYNLLLFALTPSPSLRNSLLSGMCSHSCSCFLPQRHSSSLHISFNFGRCSMWR